MNTEVAPTTPDPTAKPPATRRKDFPALLEKFKPEIERALPRHLNADRMARIALTCFRQTPKLADCQPLSVFAAVIQSAQLGLEPGLMGEAHLVPFKDTCQLIPGYQGLVKLAKQTGQVIDVYAHEVRAKDKFAVTFGLKRELIHEPLLENGFPASEKVRGEIVGFYAVAVYKDGSRTFVALSRADVDKTRDESQGYKMAVKYKRPTPWIDHYVEMGKKTAIRALCKLLPKSPELQTALRLDDVAATGKANVDLNDAISGEYTLVPDEAGGDAAGQEGAGAEERRETAGNAAAKEALREKRGEPKTPAQQSQAAQAPPADNEPPPEGSPVKPAPAATPGQQQVPF